MIMRTSSYLTIMAGIAHCIPHNSTSSDWDLAKGTIRVKYFSSYSSGIAGHINSILCSRASTLVGVRSGRRAIPIVWLIDIVYLHDTAQIQGWEIDTTEVTLCYSTF